MTLINHTFWDNMVALFKREGKITSEQERQIKEAVAKDQNPKPLLPPAVPAGRQIEVISIDGKSPQGFADLNRGIKRLNNGEILTNADLNQPVRMITADGSSAVIRKIKPHDRQDTLRLQGGEISMGYGGGGGGNGMVEISTGPIELGELPLLGASRWNENKNKNEVWDGVNWVEMTNGELINFANSHEGVDVDFIGTTGPADDINLVGITGPTGSTGDAEDIKRVYNAEELVKIFEDNKSKFDGDYNKFLEAVKNMGNKPLAAGKIKKVGLEFGRKIKKK